MYQFFNEPSNEERGQRVPSAPPIWSIIGEKGTKMGPFWGAVFHEITSSNSKFKSKGAELF